MNYDDRGRIAAGSRQDCGRNAAGSRQDRGRTARIAAEPSEMKLFFYISAFGCKRFSAK